MLHVDDDPCDDVGKNNFTEVSTDDDVNKPD